MNLKGVLEMMKKWMALSLLVILLAAPLSGLGETVAVEPLLQYRQGIAAVANTNYVIITDKHSTRKAVFSTDGTQLTDYLYNNLTYLSNDYFVGYDEAGINNRSLVHISGATLIEAAYGNFAVISRHWVLGYVLAEAPEDAEGVRYTRGKVDFLLEKQDLFYLADPDQAPRLVASLSPAQYAAAAAHGDFIAIQDQEGVITLYDRDFKAYDYPMEKVTTPIYAVKDYEIVNQVTGNVVKEGYVSVLEQMYQGELVLIVSNYNYKGEKVAGVVDLNGNEIIPMLEYDISSLSGDYAIVVKGKRKGLYSLTRRELIVPCEFNNIMASKVSMDKYVFNGYAAVENGNQRGYFNTQTGELSCEVKYTTKSVTTIGCTTYWKTENGTFILAAADGVETEVQVDSLYGKLRGDGHLLVAVKDGFYGVIDWHGNVILPFEHKNIITITDDSKALIRSSTGYELDAIMIEE